MRILRVTFLLVGFVCLGAASSVEESVRMANEAFAAGDFDTASRLLDAAGDRADDPGLVAFNRAAIHFARGEYREAELDYRRALDDADASEERQAKAWYNRGTALLQRGGSLEVYRSAIACFDRSRSLASQDSGLISDAQHNLEIAKLRWAEERKKASKAPKASASAAEDHEPRPTRPPQAKDFTPPSSAESGKGSKDLSPPKKDHVTPAAKPPKGTAQETQQPLPGAGQQKTLLDGDQLQALTVEDANSLLSEIASRLHRDRRTLHQALTGRDRAGVKDW